jgi:O-antigen/teichoic acid export membrane protein
MNASDIEPRQTAKALEKTPRLSNLRKAVGRLAVGKLSAICLGMIATPLLTHLYSPENFGTLAILTTCVTVLSPSATLSYVRAIPLASTTTERRDLVALCFVILLLTTFVLSVAVLSGRTWLADVYAMPELTTVLFLFPVMFFIAGAEQVTSMLLNCQRQYGTLAVRDVITTAGSVVLGLLAGITLDSLRSEGLLLSAVGGAFLGCVYSGAKAITSAVRDAETPLTFQRIRAVARHHRDFPLVANWGTTLSPITQGLPSLLLGLFFPLQVVGFYSMANRLVTMPMTLFSAASSKAYYVESADEILAGRSARVPTLDLLTMLSTWTTFPLFLSALLAPPVFALLLGEPWRVAGVYCQILTPWIVVAALASPLTGLYAVKQQLHEFFMMQLLFLIGRAAAILLGGMVFRAAIPTLILFSLVGVAVNILILWRCTALASISRGRILKLLLPRWLETAIFLSPATYVSLYDHSTQAILICSATGTIGYLILLAFRYRPVLMQFASHVIRPVVPSLRSP